MSTEQLEPGWYEFHTTKALTSIAYVQESGDIFIPDTEFAIDDFTTAPRILHLIREEDAKEQTPDAEALDRIGRLVTPNDGGSWSDPSGVIESIGRAVESTGREIDWEGDL